MRHPPCVDLAAGRAPGRSVGHEEAHFVDLAGPHPLGGSADVLVRRGADITHFAIWATDRPGKAAERARVREAHRMRLREGGPDGLKVVLGGPTIDEAGAMNGSLLVVEARDIAAVRAFLADDPYVLCGVYATVEVRPWRWGLGRIA